MLRYNKESWSESLDKCNRYSLLVIEQFLLNEYRRLEKDSLRKYYVSAIRDSISEIAKLIELKQFKTHAKRMDRYTIDLFCQLLDIEANYSLADTDATFYCLEYSMGFSELSKTIRNTFIKNAFI